MKDISITKQEKINKPKWLRVKLPTGESYKLVRNIVEKNKLHTICQSGNCPNMGECWGAGTATFMILGNICTRSCGFCAVKTGKPLAPDLEEPIKVAKAVRLMKVKHCVITSVDRDDLKDGGASIWAKTVKEIRLLSPRTTIETLIPDFKGNKKDIDVIVKVAPEIVSHNIETVERLTKAVRIQAKYSRSLAVINMLRKGGMKTKSGLMLGLGESQAEVLKTMKDLFNSGCQVLTIGQYLQPTPNHLAVKRFITPEEFKNYKKIGLEMGYKFVESGPLVRSSYRAEKHLF